MKSVSKFIVCLITCFAAGGIGGLFTKISVSGWYAQLIKPEFSPPNWVFAPVWNFLYFLMAVSFYLVWVSDITKYKNTALLVFLGQLLINVAWSAVFFGLRSPAGGLFIISILLVMIICTILYFGRISQKAAYLLLPYLAWVCFAGYLNYHLWILNK